MEAVGAMRTEKVDKDTNHTKQFPRSFDFG